MSAILLYTTISVVCHSMTDQEHEQANEGIPLVRYGSGTGRKKLGRMEQGPGASCVGRSRGPGSPIDGACHELVMALAAVRGSVPQHPVRKDFYFKG
jgi:hypothetical protein